MCILTAVESERTHHISFGVLDMLHSIYKRLLANYMGAVAYVATCLLVDCVLTVSDLYVR